VLDVGSLAGRRWMDAGCLLKEGRCRRRLQLEVGSHSHFRRFCYVAELSKVGGCRRDRSGCRDYRDDVGGVGNGVGSEPIYLPGRRRIMSDCLASSGLTTAYL